MVKIRDLEILIEDLLKLTPESFTEYESSLLHRRAIERQLQIMIECTIDICMVILKDLKIAIPQDEENALTHLESIIPSINVVKEMKRFRNLIVHRYGKINDEIVYNNAKEGSEDFQKFISEVKKVIKENK